MWVPAEVKAGSGWGFLPQFTFPSAETYLLSSACVSATGLFHFDSLKSSRFTLGSRS